MVIFNVNGEQVPMPIVIMVVKNVKIKYLKFNHVVDYGILFNFKKQNLGALPQTPRSPRGRGVGEKHPLPPNHKRWSFQK
jgi:hypothetical protein